MKIPNLVLREHIEQVDIVGKKAQRLILGGYGDGSWWDPYCKSFTCICLGGDKVGDGFSTCSSDVLSLLSYASEWCGGANATCYDPFV